MGLELFFFGKGLGYKSNTAMEREHYEERLAEQPNFEHTCPAETKGRPHCEKKIVKLYSINYRKSIQKAARAMEGLPLAERQDIMIEQHTLSKKDRPILIVMLTHNDRTVDNAYAIFEQCKDTKAQYWGMKEESLPLEQMKQLYAYMKRCGKTTVLEVVAYTEPESLAGARVAAECGCDILMGTIFFDSVNAFCKENHIRYMPFVGKITGRPSVLEGSMEEMIEEARLCLEKGAYGIDLLGYRYTADAKELNRRLVAEVHAPVCIAGSVNSFQRLDELKKAAPWAFTIGSAFFENKFGGSFPEQIDKVCDYIEK